jgi:DNA repair protein RadC
MAAFSRGLDDITTKLSEVIEYLRGNGLQAEAEIQSVLLLKELNRLLTFGDDPAAQVGMSRVKLALLREVVRQACVDMLSDDRALAWKRFKQAREYWITPAKGE